MLSYLGIENIAVIEETQIDFSKGFNVLTGETGAGKSIIIDSINAVLGERTSKDLIRNGCDKASVSAVFSDLPQQTVNLLKENGFSLDSEGKLFIVRNLTKSSSSIKINGKTATVGVLNEIGKNLVNIHGQHDSQSLLNADNHYIYIDRLAGNSKQIGEYYSEFKNLNSIRKRLISIETDEEEKQRRRNYLEFVVKEIEEADISVGEKDTLKTQLALAESYEKTVNAINTASSMLFGTEDNMGAVSLVSSALKSISAIKDNTAKGIYDSLCGAQAELENIAFSIEKYGKSVDNTNANKDAIMERLDIINRIIGKYGGSEESALKILNDSKSELEEIEISDELSIRLSEELDNSTQRLIELGEILSDTRKTTAKKFADDVTEILKYLDMPNVVFRVSISSGRYTKVGCDVVEFTVKTNVGEEFKPLQKIASGGELSRIMLAIKSVLADNDDVETLIFDEIDTGISGMAAGKVGNQLKTVSKSRQVICVTHLAQIAALADNHLKIEKTVNQNRTFTRVYPLDYENRIEEISRIMSGSEMTQNMYNSAKELLDRSKYNGNL